MKLLALVLSVTLLGISVASAQDEEEAAKAAEQPQLVKAKSSFQETWVNPDADFTQYDKVYLWEGTFEYRDVGPVQKSRGTMMSTRKREFGISDADRVKFEEEVSKAFRGEIAKGKRFTITDQLGSGTMILRGGALDIISLVPPQSVGRSEVYLSNIGEATLVLELLDARDGEVLAVVAERQRLQSGTGSFDGFSRPTNSATVFAEVRRWARRAASKLRTELDKAVAGK
jgi:hypothetical protein